MPSSIKGAPKAGKVLGAKVFVQKKVQNLNKTLNKIKKTPLTKKVSKVNPNI